MKLRNQLPALVVLGACLFGFSCLWMWGLTECLSAFSKPPPIHPAHEVDRQIGDAVLGLVVAGALALEVCCGLCFSLVHYGNIKNAERLGFPLTQSAWRSVLTLWLPGLNLTRPYSDLRALLTAGSASTPRGLRAWEASWVVFNVGHLAFAFTRFLALQPMSLLAFLACGLSALPLAVLTLWLGTAISRRHDHLLERAARRASAPAVSAPAPAPPA